jgi:nitrogen fixation NifU-like protein
VTTLEDFSVLAALSGVSQFPTRVKCAALAWQALRQVLDDAEAATVTTEASDQ